MKTQHQRLRAANPRSALPAGGTLAAHPHALPAVHRLLYRPRPQPKLTVGAPNDAFEQEADRVANHVMRMPDPSVQRKCAACAAEDEETLRAKAEPGGQASVPAGFESRFNALHGGGQPLPASERSFFEPRFGRDFSSVRVHHGPAAGELARSVNARAFTLGSSVVFGDGEYAPGSPSGRSLLAHELTHVVQQGGGGTSGRVQRQTMHASCAGKEAVLEAAWQEGKRLTERTIETLDFAQSALGAGVVPSSATAIQNAFGDVGLTPGFTRLPDLRRRYGQLLAAFTAGKTLRCDPESVPSDKNECDWRVAFVLVGNNTDLYFCPSFFDGERTLIQRGLTVLHEMAHSVLRASHAGFAERTVPEGLLACELPLGLDYDDAKRNAFAYEMLANCLHGERPSAKVDVPAAPATKGKADAAKPDARWSISAGAGADVTPDAYRFASTLSGRVSLRTGEFVVFNPVIGLNLLYLPSSASNPSSLVAATADIGLRIQQPLSGFYFDVAAGGWGGFDIDPGRAESTRAVGGPTAATGLGWRWNRLELGAETRALVPGTDFDKTNVLIFGKAALRFP